LLVSADGISFLYVGSDLGASGSQVSEHLTISWDISNSPSALGGDAPFMDGTDPARLSFREPLGTPVSIAQLATAFARRRPTAPDPEDVFELPEDLR
jgi:hypothetical protein